MVSQLVAHLIAQLWTTSARLRSTPWATMDSMHETVEAWPDGDWVVRRITGSSSTKPYRCPGCDQLIRPATPHVVAWPVESTSFTGEGIDERRHWHTGCWRARGRRARR